MQHIAIWKDLEGSRPVIVPLPTLGRKRKGWATAVGQLLFPSPVLSVLVLSLSSFQPLFLTSSTLSITSPSLLANLAGQDRCFLPWVPVPVGHSVPGVGLSDKAGLPSGPPSPPHFGHQAWHSELSLQSAQGRRQACKVRAHAGASPRTFTLDHMALFLFLYC